MNEPTAIAAIESWFRDNSDGEWEHRYGFKLESTDNPGWLITFKELRVCQESLAEIIGDLLRRHSAQVATDGTMVRVFAPTLKDVLIAAATVLQSAETGR
jgi:hypothetical protein